MSRLTFGGGVDMYIHNAFSFTIRQDLIFVSTQCESLFIEIPQSNGKNIVVGIVYKPPEFNTNEFVQLFDSSLAKLNTENKHAFIMGDFNIDLLKHKIHNPSSHCIDCLAV